MIPLFKLNQDGVKEAVCRVIDSGQFIGGPIVRECEESVAEYVGKRYAVACGSGTDALRLIIEATGYSGEVYTTPFTFAATAESVIQAGCTVRFGDISDDFCLQPDSAGMTVPVSIFGHPLGDYDGIVVEDACQAIGTTRVGIAQAFSFFPSKNLGGIGDGGIVTTDDEGLAQEVRLLANHGMPRKYHHTKVGCNSRLDAVQAAAVLAKMPRLADETLKRQEAAAYYDMYLDVRTPPQGGVYHLYVIRSTKRDAIQAALADAGIASCVYYPEPLHLSEAYRTGVSLPNTEKACAEALAIPCFPGITQQEQDRVIEVVNAIGD